MDKSIKKSIDKGDLGKITTYQAGVMQAATHRILQKYCDDVLRPYGITKMQWLVIGLVLDAGEAGIRITDLAAKLGTTLAYLTTTINLLESKQMVLRTVKKSDTRTKFVSINLAFAPTCKEIESYLRDELRSTIYAEISPADFRTYMRVLYQLSSTAKD